MPLGESPDQESTKSAVDEKSLVRRIDFHVIPMLFIIYVASFLDRVNVSYALTMGLPEELGLKGNQLNIALTLFFIPYALFEIPSNLVMKRLQPHIWLSSCICVFGVITLCQGFVQSYKGLLATRFLLGLAEAGIYPGSVYLISFWYSHSEIQKRLTVFASSIMFAGAFGGLLATAIANMDNVRGLSNWRWIFILEGMITVIIGLSSFVLVTNFPLEAKWLSSAEKELVLAKSQSNETHTIPVKVADVLKFFKDIRNVLGGIMWVPIGVNVYSFAYFTPTIVKSFGYSVVQTQLHSVPPYMAAIGLCLVTAYISDRIRLRYPFVALGYAILIAGIAILMNVHGRGHFSAEYAGICLVNMGIPCVATSTICWYLMNLHGHTQRSIGSGWIVGFGNLSGIAGTFTFQKADAPFYHTGYSICIAAAAAGAALSLLYGALIWQARRSTTAADDQQEASPKLYF